MTANATRLKELYPAGTRIKLIEMREEKRPVPTGTIGTVEKVDDIGTIHMIWDSGSSLGLIPGVDAFEVTPCLSAAEADEREALIFNEKYDESSYDNGIRQFDSLPIDVAKALIEKGFMDAESKGALFAPKAKTFIDFCENAEDRDIWTCHGFVKAASTGTKTVFIMGLNSNSLPRSVDRVCEFANRFYEAGFFQMSPENGCFCSYF